ncbi:MAG: argininosuccinate lyase [Bacteroidota bacterium]
METSQAKKLWEKGISTDEWIERFTVGNDRQLDLELAKYDVQGTIAHITMLESIGLLTADELGQLVAELKRILEEVIEPGHFVIEEGVEDVHSQVELMLTEALGDVGKKVHAGRSRNDQVLVDLRLFFREELRAVSEYIRMLFDELIAQSEANKEVLIPGYTHTQAAMPSSFGLWFGAYAESLTDDTLLLASVLELVNRNPLGSAAGYGSSFPLNRTMTSELLDFDGPNVNVVYAQMTRTKIEQSIAFALSGLATTLNKLASDICMYNSQNFGFIKLPDELTTGSSIMPHKKNPDVFELIRVKTNRIKALPNEVMMATTNLTSGYHRDFQLLKDMLFPALADIKELLSITAYAIHRMNVNPDIMDDDRYRLIFSVEKVNELVQSGVPFRDAYKTVAEEIESGKFQQKTELNHTHLGSIGNLGNGHIQKRMNQVMQAFVK